MGKDKSTEIATTLTAEKKTDLRACFNQNRKLETVYFDEKGGHHFYVFAETVKKDGKLVPTGNTITSAPEHLKIVSSLSRSEVLAD